MGGGGGSQQGGGCCWYFTLNKNISLESNFSLEKLLLLRKQSTIIVACKNIDYNWNWPMDLWKYICMMQLLCEAGICFLESLCKLMILNEYLFIVTIFFVH